MGRCVFVFFFFFQAEDGIRDVAVTGVQTCALPICARPSLPLASDMVARTPVSIVIPTRNEALQIGECVRGLAWAGEVIVVDGASADGTAESARAAGARVLNGARAGTGGGSEEHTSELQSRLQIVCPLLLVKKKKLTS